MKVAKIIRDWLVLSRFRFSYLIAIICGITFANKLLLLPISLVIILTYSGFFYGVFTNFIHDYNIDHKNPSMRRYPHISGKISSKKLELISLISLSLIILTGISLTLLKKNIAFIIFAILAVHCGYSYSALPLRWKRFWWGGMITYTLSTALTFLVTVFALDVSFSPMLILPPLVFWFGSLSAWALTHISDRDFDKQENVETLPIKFKIGTCVLLYRILFILSSLFGMAISVFFLDLWWAPLSFIFTVVLAYFFSKYIIKDSSPEKIRWKAHTLGVIPYRLNIILLTILYFVR